MTTTPVPPNPDILTAHFRLSEFAVSAGHPELVRPVPLALVPRIRKVAHLLEIIRDRIGHPMQILSGYRSSALNAAAEGSPTSQHVTGEAADWTTPTIRADFEAVLDLVYSGAMGGAGQIIYYPEKHFVHIALESPRFQRPTTCLHWPAKGMKYRPFTPSRVQFAQLMATGTQP